MTTAARIAALDGMRTLAILLVLVFHLNDKYLPGGFIGVDIFFVISGYIISRNIVTEFEQRHFSFADFYWRRVTRLVPAAVVTVVVSLFAATFVYSPAILREFGETAFFAATWSVNIFFWLHSGYWDDASQGNIFLHMWSLSVEEQFYLVWPLLVVVLMLRFRKSIGTAFGLITIIGAIAAYAAFLYSPTFAFYMMPSRAFQFAAGAAIAIAHLRYPATFNGKHSPLHPLIFLLGLAGISLAAWFADGADYNFWVAAVLPTAGAAAAIFAMNSRPGQALLAPRSVQYVGRRAYSLYLVHWPLIVMTSIFYGVDKPATTDAAILLACFALGEALFRLVEDRFRMRGQIENYRQKLSAASFGILSLLVAGHFWILNPAINGGSEQAGTGSYVRLAGSLWGERSGLAHTSKNKRCALRLEDPFESYNQKLCLLGPATNKILIIGDSMALEAYILLSQIFSDERLVLAGSGGCAPIFPEPAGKSRAPGCRAFTQARYEWIDRSDISAIAITANWQFWKPGEMDSTFSRLAQTGKPVIIIGVRPRFSTHIPKLLDSAAWGKARKDLTPYIAFSMSEREAQLQQAAKRHGDQFYYVPVGNYLCPSNCPALHADGSLVFMDQIHITGQTALGLGRQINQDHGARLRSFVDPIQQDVSAH